MSIHHATAKKAEKMGVLLEEKGDTVRAFWPKHAVELHCPSAQDALQQMQAVIAISGMGLRVGSDGGRLIHVYDDDGHRLVGGPRAPFEVHQMLIKSGGATSWEDPLTEMDGSGIGPGTKENDDGIRADSGDRDSGEAAAGVGEAAPRDTPVERSDKGIALDGGVAYREGTPAGDNPFATDEDEEEYERAAAWDEAWDAAADEATDDEGKGGSVVNEKYRAKYAELGHPEHCGDWLAEIFNNLVKTKTGTDVARVDAIAKANGVDNSKYDRTRPGWQGRLRMTTRNLLARVVWMNDGVMYDFIEGEGMQEYRAPADWMANQRFKKPKVKAEPAPDTE